MRSLHRVASSLVTATAFLAVAGCGDLEVTNPNQPDRSRVLATPGDVVSLAGSSMSTWFNAAQGMEAGGPLNTMADAYSASWNNYFMRIHSSEPRTHYRNDPGSAERTTVEWYWYQYYSALASANDALRVIESGALQWTGEGSDTAALHMTETMATFIQGVALSELALNYDKALIVFQDTDISALEFSDRVAVRDAALEKLDAAIALAGANEFETPAAWTGGNSYSNGQIAQIANTQAARLLAYFARDAAENAQTDWARVATYASNGISKPGEEFDFLFTGDGNCPDVTGARGICNEIVLWANDPTTMHVDDRIANLLDPATQQNPGLGNNPRPNSPDRRLGNGSYGTASWANGLGAGAIPADGGGGTDFMWHALSFMRADRGLYHRSNITQVRYNYASFTAPDGSGGGLGDTPLMTMHENDLLWAEGLIRSGGSLATAAELINNTRVDRGGLAPASAGDGVNGLLAKLQYEQDVELLGLNVVPYYNRRRIDGLQPLTPRIMPVPAQELGVLQEALYTYGGTFGDGGSTSTASILASVGSAKVHAIAKAQSNRSRGLERRLH
jgi:hypothetical protein